LNINYFIAKRFSYSQQGKQQSMRPGIKIATFGIAVGLAVMIIAFAVVIGFKQEVSNQVIGFGSHIQISEFNSSNSYQKLPISMNDSLLKQISDIQGVDRVEQVITNPAVIKTENDFKAVIFKGIDSTYNLNFFKKNLKDGSLPDFSENKNNVLISKSLSEKLNLKTGDDFFTYFFQHNVRVRKFTISGIYATTYSEFDNVFIIGSLPVARTLNQWDNTQFSTLEITISDFNNIDTIGAKIQGVVGNRFNENELLYNTQTIKQLSPQIFIWLDMLDVNAWVILVLMMAVAGFNMIACLLILILERTQTIGIFKALGMKNAQIRQIFLYHALFFVVKGMIIGNLIGIGIIVIQYFTHIIPLNPQYYYVNYAPVVINPLIIILLNVIVFVSSILMLLLPSHIITKILPAAAIRFE
jgi:lipoprotein-releasing system permease protein